MRQRRPFARLVRIGGALALLVFLEGCGSFQLYSPERDKQAEAAKTAWTQAKTTIGEQVSAARTTATALLEQEFLSEERSVYALREATMRRLAYGESVGAVLGTADAGKKASDLVGSVNEFNAWQAARLKEREWAREFTNSSRELQRFGLEMPDCKDIGKPDTMPQQLDAWFTARKKEEGSDAATGRKVSELAHAALRTAQVLCDTDADKTGKPRQRRQATKDSPLADGELNGKLKQLEAARQALANLQESSKQERNTLRGAIKAYEVAAADLKKGKPATEAVQKAAKVLADAGQKMIKASEVTNDVFGKAFLSEARGDSLDKLLAALGTTAEGKSPPEDAGALFVALNVIPSFIDESRNTLADTRQSLLLPLVMERDRQQGLVDVLSKDIALQKTELALLDAEFEVMLRRAILLRDASGLYEKNLKSQGNLGVTDLHKKLAQADGPGSRGKRVMLYRALGLYLHAQGPLLAQQSKLNLQRLALSYERGVNYAEGAVRQWHALIDTSVALLDAYAKSGAKTEDITGLVTAIGIIGIAQGVNKP